MGFHTTKYFQGFTPFPSLFYMPKDHQDLTALAFPNSRLIWKKNMSSEA
jgi:hypothetical protein